MKKYISMFMVTLLTIGSLFSIPAHAEEKQEGLTYEQALNIAIDSNDSLRKLNKEYKQLWDQRNSISDKFPESAKSSPTYVSTIIQSSKQLEGTAKVKQLEYDTTFQGIELQLKKIFYSIKIHEENIDLKSKQIANMRGTLDIEMLKNSYGVTSDFDVRKIQNDLEKAQKQKTASDKEVQKQYFALNKVLGQSTVKYVDIVPIDIEYKKVDDQEAESRIGSFLSNSPQVAQQKLMVDLLELQQDLYPLNLAAAVSPQSAMQMDKPDVISDKISVTSDTIKVQKKNVEEQIRNMQNSLKTIELNVQTLESQLKGIDERIRIANAQYKAGVIIKKQVEDIEFQRKSVENTIYNLKAQHTLLRLQFEKPYLMQA